MGQLYKYFGDKHIFLIDHEKRFISIVFMF